MTLKRMDNVLIVVDDLEAAKAFFIELGLKLEGETTVEGPLVGSLQVPAVASPRFEPPNRDQLVDAVRGSVCKERRNHSDNPWPRFWRRGPSNP
jgi:catechol 2,3-dioxygenase-like lactoylglutathione lyase family enzyme